MASLTKQYTKTKLLGQIYTPRFIVEKILLDVGYAGEAILGKTILDPSCGDGRFLTVVAEKIIACSPPDQLKQNLECLYGWDIDADAVAACLQNLHTLVQDLGISVDWKISTCNSLKKILEVSQKFDFIVGNPPYVRIQHLEGLERKFIQGIYRFCQKGSTDIYIAFYELCLALLAEEGVCGLITPNTFFYTETAKAMRAYFERHQNIKKITNYGDIQVFENATTYSTIFIFDRKNRSSFLFEFAKDLYNFQERYIDFSEITNSPQWRLSIAENLERKGERLGDICKIHVGITTLADKVYMLKWDGAANHEDTNLVWAESRLAGKILIERAILKPIIKASKWKGGTKAQEYILFPYAKKAGKHQIIPETHLKAAYPLAYAYLENQRDVLLQRDNGKNNAVAWYAFGRCQGLDTSFGKKILFSPMNAAPNFLLSEDEDCTFYSGYCIKYDGDYNFLLAQLNSERLANFVAISARDFRGGWKAYNKKTLAEFRLMV